MEWLLKILTAFVRPLIPPDPSVSDVRGVYKWRIAVALTAGGTALLTAGFIAWACGAFFIFGFPGFVKAADLDALREYQNRAAQQIVARLGNIEKGQASNKAANARRAVFDYTEKYCRAQNDETKRTYFDQQQTALSDWYESTNGRPFNIPSCSELKIGQQ